MGTDGERVQGKSWRRASPLRAGDERAVGIELKCAREGDWIRGNSRLVNIWQHHGNISPGSHSYIHILAKYKPNCHGWTYTDVAFRLLLLKWEWKCGSKCTWFPNRAADGGEKYKEALNRIGRSFQLTISERSHSDWRYEIFMHVRSRMQTGSFATQNLKAIVEDLFSVQLKFTCLKAQSACCHVS